MASPENFSLEDTNTGVFRVQTQVRVVQHVKHNHPKTVQFQSAEKTSFQAKMSEFVPRMGVPSLPGGGRLCFAGAPAQLQGRPRCNPGRALRQEQHIAAMLSMAFHRSKTRFSFVTVFLRSNIYSTKKRKRGQNTPKQPKKLRRGNLIVTTGSRDG